MSVSQKNKIRYFWDNWCGNKNLGILGTYLLIYEIHRHISVNYENIDQVFTKSRFNEKNSLVNKYHCNHPYRIFINRNANHVCKNIFHSFIFSIHSFSPLKKKEFLDKVRGFCTIKIVKSKHYSSKWDLRFGLSRGQIRGVR